MARLHADFFADLVHQFAVDDCDTFFLGEGENCFLCHVAYEERDIRENLEHGKVLEEKTGKLGVPYIVIDGEWKRGYDVGKPFSEDFARDLFAN